LRLASEEGPQRIGTRRRYRLVTEEQWQHLAENRPPVGKWLLANIPRDEPLELPSRVDPPRPDAFSEQDLP